MADTTPRFQRRERVTGERRNTVAVQLVERYRAGECIRDLATATGRSYGFIHRILTENDALRPRGGPGRRRRDGDESR